LEEEAMRKKEGKTFDLGTVLGVITMKLLSPRGVKGNEEIFAFLLSNLTDWGNLMNQYEICQKHLLKCYPELAKANSLENLRNLETLINDAKYHDGESEATAVEMWLKWMAEPDTCDLRMEYIIFPIPRPRKKKNLKKKPRSS
jgi:hypothetical protein